MINFFRKIRQQLANENKFQRYFRYALGEVLLVVIGILIALSINNWNDNRIERIKEQEMLLTLKNNLLLNVDILNQDIKQLKYRYNSCDTILEVIKYKRPMFDSLRYYFHEARMLSLEKLSFSGFESLKSFGFDLIENGNLRNEIITLFESTYSRVTENLAGADINTNPQIQSYYMTHFELFDANVIPNNYNLLIEDQVFKNYILMKKSLHFWGISLKEPSITETERIIALINEELTKK